MFVNIPSRLKLNIINFAWEKFGNKANGHQTVFDL